MAIVPSNFNILVLIPPFLQNQCCSTIINKHLWLASPNCIMLAWPLPPRLWYSRDTMRASVAYAVCPHEWSKIQTCLKALGGYFALATFTAISICYIAKQFVVPTTITIFASVKEDSSCMKIMLFHSFIHRIWYCQVSTFLFNEIWHHQSGSSSLWSYNLHHVILPHDWVIIVCM